MDRFLRGILTFACALVLSFLMTRLMPLDEGMEFLGYGGFMVIACALLSVFIRVDGSNRKDISATMGWVGIVVFAVNLFVYNNTNVQQQLPEHWHVATFCLFIGFALGYFNYYLPIQKEPTYI